MREVQVHESEKIYLKALGIIMYIMTEIHNCSNPAREYCFQPFQVVLGNSVVKPQSKDFIVLLFHTFIPLSIC